jgi:hypothetical protein
VIKSIRIVGWACSSDGEGRGVYRVLVRNLRKRDHWGDSGVDGRIILRWIFRKFDVGGMDWIGLAQDRDMLRGIS